MTEQESSPEELEVFREEIREAIESTIFILSSSQDEGPFDVDPMSLGIGEETLPELSAEKQTIVKNELYRLLGMHEKEKQPTNTYTASDDETISVSVFEGQEIDEEGEEQLFYLHEIKHEGDELDWQLSNSSDPLL